MSVSVEPAKAEEGPQIGTILSNWITETSWMPRIHSPEQDLAHGGWLIDVCSVMVVRKRDRVAGFLARQSDRIQALYVAQGARGRGIGSALLAQAKSDSDRLGLWTFQANGPALQFYAGQGFAEDQRTDGAGNDEGLPDIHMVWERGLA